MDRYASVLLVACFLAAGCSKESEEPPRRSVGPQVTTIDFETRLRSIRVGMTTAEVELALGRPEDIGTPPDHAGTWTLGTSVTWGYGVEAHRGPATKGAVYFDEAGKVQYVFGHLERIEPRE